MKTKEEIEQLADDYATSIYGYTNCNYNAYLDCKKHCIEFYNLCQKDTKQILLDFIKWSNAFDEYGNKLDKIDIDNFLNKQD